MSPSELLTLIAEQARALRAAGVQEVSTPEFTIKLTPSDPPEPRMLTATELADRARASEPVHPLDDPDTYMGGVVPRFPDGIEARGKSYATPTQEFDDD